MSGPLGTYGMRLTGLPNERWLQPAPDEWPQWTFSRGEPLKAPVAFSSDEDRVQIPLLNGDGMELYRSSRNILYASATDPGPSAWVHPVLAPAAMFVADWAGRLAFHAGAFLDRHGRCWVVFGNRNDGKSTALAWLAQNGASVLADDLVITDGRSVFSGPRCVDLRAGAAAHLGVGHLVEEAGLRERWRVTLPQTLTSAPLAGFIQLAWSEIERYASAELMPDATERRDAVLGARALLTSQQHPRPWLGVLASTVLRFERPRDWQALDGAMARLVACTNAL